MFDFRTFNVNTGNSVFAFAIKCALVGLLFTGCYIGYRYGNSLPEGSNAPQGKTKFSLLNYEKDTSPIIVPPVFAPVIVAPEETNHRTSCSSPAPSPCESCNNGNCDRTGSPVQIVSINGMPTPSTATTSKPSTTPPKPIAEPQPQPVMCGGDNKR